MKVCLLFFHPNWQFRKVLFVMIKLINVRKTTYQGRYKSPKYCQIFQVLYNFLWKFAFVFITKNTDVRP